MKNCPNCGEVSEDQFDTCWKCSTPLPNQVVNVTPGANAMAGKGVQRQAQSEIFRGSADDWDAVARDAAAFVSQLGPEKLITLSQSHDSNQSVIIVWYWNVS